MPPCGSTNPIPRADTFLPAVCCGVQLQVLECVFQTDPLPRRTLRNELATQLGITPRCVQVWFQNRRQKWKHTHQAAGQPVPALSNSTQSRYNNLEKLLAPSAGVTAPLQPQVGPPMYVPFDRQSTPATPDTLIASSNEPIVLPLAPSHVDSQPHQTDRTGAPSASCGGAADSSISPAILLPPDTQPSPPLSAAPSASASASAQASCGPEESQPFLFADGPMANATAAAPCSTPLTPLRLVGLQPLTGAPIFECLPADADGAQLPIAHPSGGVMRWTPQGAVMLPYTLAACPAVVQPVQQPVPPVQPAEPVQPVQPMQPMPPMPPKPPMPPMQPVLGADPTPPIMILPAPGAKPTPPPVSMAASMAAPMAADAVAAAAAALQEELAAYATPQAVLAHGEGCRRSGLCALHVRNLDP